jgi:hypothetical protein
VKSDHRRGTFRATAGVGHARGESRILIRDTWNTDIVSELKRTASA